MKRNELKMRKSSVTFRRALSTAFVAVSVFATIPADAAPFPEKAIRMVVAFPPGGGGDFMARIMGEKLGDAWRQPVITDNRPGASATIGAAIAAKAPADGYTLFLVTTELVIAPNFVRSLTYDPVRSFAPITQTGRQSYILAAHPSLGVSTVKELIATLKAKNGRVNFGSAGAGSPGHLSGELFKLSTGTQMTPIPYKGESALMPDLISGQVSLGFLNLPSVAPHIKSGKLRALGISSPIPNVDMPGVPTFRSLSLQSLEVQGWAALLAPKGSISEDGLTRLEILLTQALSSEVVKNRFMALNVSPVIQSRQATAIFLRNESSRYGKIIKDRAIKPD